MTTTLSTEAHRSIVLGMIDELEERGHYPQLGIQLNGTSHSPAGLRRFLKDAPVGYLADAQRALNVAEDASIGADRRKAEEEAREATRNAPHALDGLYDDIIRDTNQRAAFRQTDSGRLETLIEQNARILAQLEKK